MASCSAPTVLKPLRNWRKLYVSFVCGRIIARIRPLARKERVSYIVKEHAKSRIWGTAESTSTYVDSLDLFAFPLPYAARREALLRQ